MAKKSAKTQIDGQMTLYDFCTNIQNYVAQSNTLILGKQNLKLNSAKLIRSAIMQVVREDTELKPYKVSINDLSKMFGVTPQNLYQSIDDITNDIFHNPLFIRQVDENGKTTGFIKMSWVSTCEYNEGLGLALKLNDDLKPLLLGLKEKYTQYTLDTILEMKSTYSIRLYELLLEGVKNKGGMVPYEGCDIQLSVQEIKECLGCEDKYPMYGHFKDRVIKPSIEEITDLTTIKVTYTEVKYSRSVEDIIFHLERTQPNKD